MSHEPLTINSRSINELFDYILEVFASGYYIEIYKQKQKELKDLVTESKVLKPSSHTWGVRKHMNADVSMCLLK